MLKIDFSEEDLVKLKQQLKSIYNDLSSSQTDNAVNLHKKYEKVFANIWDNTRGFEYYGEGIDTDIKIALSSKKKEDKDKYLSKAIDKMKNDLSDVYYGIFKDSID